MQRDDITEPERIMRAERPSLRRVAAAVVADTDTGSATCVAAGEDGA